MASSGHGASGAAQARITRRRLLRAAGGGAAGLALSGGLAELLVGALAAGGPAPPTVPRWHSRPDLRIPTLTVLSDDPAASRDPIFIAPYNAPNAQAGAVIVAADGEAIWENPLANAVTTNFRVQHYRGSPVLTWWEGSIELGHGVGEYVIADTGYRTIRRVQAAGGLRGDLHEFVITPRDTALLTSYAVRNADLTAVGGPRNGTIQDAIFQEIDLSSGRLLLEWHSLEHIPLAESYAPVSADWDFFHINSVDLDGDGNLLISGRSTHTIYKLARDGTILWRLGGRYGDFTLGAGAQFAWQHDARRQPDGTLSVFDNGATPAVEPRSRGLILDVDERAMTAGLRHQYTHARVLAGSQGSVQLLANGNVFVGWGEVPRVSEFDRDGRLLFDALLGRQYQSYRSFRLPWSGRPAQAPALAVARAAGGRLTAYASWNGATDVGAWQLLAGAGGVDLHPVAQVPVRGFESALRVPPRAGPRLAAQALDGSGRPLGRSAELDS
ncbi:MAG TPA: arylsulfotransferase family protein [Solirubrobacteraceae bacterium]|nr:arylsulfotransferase family protein [Solirubrobacteraceae bacterium]